MRYGLPILLRKLSSAGIGCSCARHGRVVRASNAVMTAKRKRDATAPKRETASRRMYPPYFLQGNTQSPFVDLFLAVAPNSFCNGKSARVPDDFVWMLESQIDCANRAYIQIGRAH